MTVYYNEFDPYAAAWLRNLIAAGHIAPGEVDERSITEVQPDDLRGFTQCHFFAGIGGWSLALRLAGWGDYRPVWTGSCPCQLFSADGKQLGTADERHLWPAWHRLIAECHPAIVFGEQVEAAIRLGWLDLVQADLEGLGYAVGAAGLPAACVGAPHIRQRLWFVAHGTQFGRGEERAVGGRFGTGDRAQGRPAGLESGGDAGLVADIGGARLEGRARAEKRADECAPRSRSVARALADDDATGRGAARQSECRSGATAPGGGPQEPRGSDRAGPWDDVVWLPCRDGKARPIEPGTFPLAHGVQNRVGRLRAYGNAIVPQVAAAFIRAFEEVRAAA